MNSECRSFSYDELSSDAQATAWSHAFEDVQYNVDSCGDWATHITSVTDAVLGDAFGTHGSVVESMWFHAQDPAGAGEGAVCSGSIRIDAGVTVTLGEWLLTYAAPDSGLRHVPGCLLWFIEEMRGIAMHLSPPCADMFGGTGMRFPVPVRLRMRMDPHADDMEVEWLCEPPGEGGGRLIDAAVMRFMAGLRDALLEEYRAQFIADEIVYHIEDMAFDEKGNHA